MNNESVLTPQDEIRELRLRIKEKREQVGAFESHIKPLDQAREVLTKYVNEQSTKSPTQIPSIKASEETKLLSALSPKDTDAQVKLLAQVAASKGIKQAIALARKNNNPQVEDDLERYLAQYLLLEKDAKKTVDDGTWKALHMRLYEVVIPDVMSGDDNGAGRVKEVMTLMEQWYASMQAYAADKKNGDNYFTLELALPEGSNDISFYCAIQEGMTDLFEKTLAGTFPELKVSLCPDDYNIFSPAPAVAGAYATPAVSSALPLKTYKELEGDPISVMLASFTKIKQEGEGVAVQLLLRPHDENNAKKYGEMLDKLRKGEAWKKVMEHESAIKEVFEMLDGMFSTKQSEEKKEVRSHDDEVAMKEVARKLESAIATANIRIVVSAETKERADAILSEIASSFAQYSLPSGAGVTFKNEEGSKLQDLIHDFEYRLWNEKEEYPLNLSEVATMFHFPLYVKEPGQLRSTRAKVAQAPLDLPQEGVLLGINTFRHLKTEVHMGKEDRMRHLYVIGQTGTGKTTVLKNMIIQDIKNGDGCCFIDPHGSDIDDILANIPKNRLEDVIYFDPSYTDRPLGLNMLEYDVSKPDQKIFVVNELLSIFKKLFAGSSPESMGPAFEQYFRNTAMLVMEHPQSGNTLLDLLRVLSDKDFRDYKLSKCKNPLIAQFWKNAEATTGDQGLQNYVPYISNKFDVFLSNDVMRPIISQEKSSIDIRKIMDEKKIFLVNLSKGRLGDINAQLIGLILVGKFLQAALARVDTDVRPDFYLYIDEFQNVTTPSISAILSEARKYRLSLTMAHQFIAQLPEDIKGAVFGNVGSKAFFRVGPDDAQYLESQIAPVFNASDIMKIENYNCYLSLLSKGSPQKPFNISILAPEKGDRGLIDKLKEASFLAYGRPRAEIEAEIMKKYS